MTVPEESSQGFATQSHWLARSAAAYSRLDADEQTDVVVLGGGLAGTAAALFLAEQGSDVVLLEAQSIADGASGRNGGFILAGTVDDFATAVDIYGPGTAQRIWDFSVRNLDLAAELAERLHDRGVDCGYRRSGSLRLADSKEELKQIERSAALLAGSGHELTPVEESSLPPSLRGLYLGGAISPLDGEYDPAAFVRGLAMLAAEAGAIIYEGSAAISIEEDGKGVTVSTPAGKVRARQALVTLNAYSSELLPELKGLIRPVRGQALSTASLDERLFDMPCYGHYGYHWWRQLASGELVAGGWRHESLDSEECSDDEPCNPVQGHIERFVARVAPGAMVERRWAGLMAFTPDGLPLVGRVPGRERTWIAGGYNGHGNGLALLCVQGLTESMFGRAWASASLFSPARLSSSKG